MTTAPIRLGAVGYLNARPLVHGLERNPAFSLGPSGYGAFPPVNIFEDNEGGTVIIAEAPGIDPAKLIVSGNRNTLTISGERVHESVEDLKGYHRRERRFGKFSRSIQLPDDLDMSTASASRRTSLRAAKASAASPMSWTPT